jgi:hypothetical protein
MQCIVSDNRRWFAAFSYRKFVPSTLSLCLEHIFPLVAEQPASDIRHSCSPRSHAVSKYLAKSIRRILKLVFKKMIVLRRVADPDPSDPYVFGPPGSGSVSQMTDPDPSIIKQKKLLLFDLLSLKNDVNVPSKNNSKKTFKKISFLLES